MTEPQSVTSKRPDRRIGLWVARAVMMLTTVTIALFVCELIMRRMIPREEPNSSEWLRLLNDLPEKDQFLQDRTQFTSLQYHDYYLYSLRPHETQTMTVRDFFSTRACPDSVALGKAKEIVWMFGGSTMQNMETTDQRTIANQVAKYLNQAGVPTSVSNFGVGSFQSSLELARFEDTLRRAAPNERPTVAVFYDGFNDSRLGYLCGAGNMQNDVSNKLRILVEGDYKSSVRYNVSQLFSQSGLALLKPLATLTEPSVIRSGWRNDGSRQNLEKSVSIFLDNIRMARAICHEFKIRPVFVLQPLVITKNGRTEFEEADFSAIDPELRRFINDFYSIAREEMRKSPDCLDLSGVLDNDNRSDFYDLGHTGPYTGETIGRAIGGAIYRNGLSAN